jgi:hypothetical protein
MEVLRGSNQWNVSFSREAHDWELEVFTSFFQVLHSIRVRRGCEDKLRWTPSKRGLFKVKALFYSLACYEDRSFPWKSVWRTQAPLRSVFFVWLVALVKILTLDNLRKHHVIVINRCCMCKKSEETEDHLLLHCEIAFVLCFAIFSLFGLAWVMLRRVFDLLAYWWSFGRRRSVVVPTCLFWCLWQERNNRCFEDLKRSLEDFLSYCFHTLYLWTVAHLSPVSICYDDFLICFSLSS